MSILPQLEQELLRAAEERLGQARSRRRRRLPVGSLALAASVLVAGAVAVLALTALHRTPRPEPSVTAAPMARIQLIQTLGVLRRPQTRAERILSGTFSIRHVVNPLAAMQDHRAGTPSARTTVDRSLVRVVKDGADDEVWIVPATHTSQSGQQTVQLYVAAHTDATATGPASLQTLQTRGVGLFTHSPVDPSSGRNWGVLVVPDGVARVTLTRLRVAGPVARVRPTVEVNRTAVVHSNVASFSIRIPPASIPTATAGLYLVNAIAQMIWRDARGRLVRMTTMSVQVTMRLRGGPRPKLGTTGILNSAFCTQNPQACQ